MIIKVADPSGFCFGVSRAVELAEEHLKHDNLVSLGKIIHNQDEISRLESLGMKTAEGMEGLTDRVVLVRSHGESRETMKLIEEEHTLINATCPFVTKLQRIVEHATDTGKQVIILGSKNHPEIQGVIGWAKSDKVHTANNMEELKALNISNEDTVVCAQTTLQESFWNEAEEYLKGLGNPFEFRNTICSATKDRQRAAAALAKEVDLMIIIGGKESSNTKKLFQICESINKNTVLIENRDDLIMKNLQNYGIVGISAGASTPQWVIQDIVDALKKLEE